MTLQSGLTMSKHRSNALHTTGGVQHLAVRSIRGNRLMYEVGYLVTVGHAW